MLLQIHSRLLREFFQFEQLGHMIHILAVLEKRLEFVQHLKEAMN
jgi:hypothetical protein